jgi:uncharacterized protein YndB with AHSA1/START domain
MLEGERAGAGVIRIEQQVAIDAPPARVFEALTKQVSAWGGAPYLIGQGARDLVVEPRIGGRVYEDWGGGAGALWATVTSIKKNDHIEWTGRIGMGGAVVGVVAYRVEPQGKGTLLKLSHRAVGEVTAETERNYGGGWQDLLGTRLRAFVERGERQGLRTGAARAAGKSVKR